MNDQISDRINEIFREIRVFLLNNNEKPIKAKKNLIKIFSSSDQLGKLNEKIDEILNYIESLNVYDERSELKLISLLIIRRTQLFNKVEKAPDSSNPNLIVGLGNFTLEQEKIKNENNRIK